MAPSSWPDHPQPPGASIVGPARPFRMKQGCLGKGRHQGRGHRSEGFPGCLAKGVDAADAGRHPGHLPRDPGGFPVDPHRPTPRSLRRRCLTSQRASWKWAARWPDFTVAFHADAHHRASPDGGEYVTICEWPPDSGDQVTPES